MFFGLLPEELDVSSTQINQPLVPKRTQTMDRTVVRGLYVQQFRLDFVGACSVTKPQKKKWDGMECVVPGTY